ncbi:MAG: VOC family protein [Nitrosopumilus sp.]|nr:VOC family protein [Nitrosopumilus sp.]
MNNLKAKSIDHVNMKVKNLIQSVDFYKNLFGFEIKQEENPNKIDVPSKIIGNDAIKLCMYEVPNMFLKEELLISSLTLKILIR